MKRAALLFALAAAPLATLTPVEADACAMRKRPVKKVGVEMVAKLIQKGEKAEKAGLFAVAARHYEKAVSGRGSATDRAKAAHKAGVVYLTKVKDAAKARRLLVRAAGMAPDNAEYRLTAGLALVDSEPAVAMNHLKAALEKGASDASSAYLGLARVNLKMDRTDAARAALVAAQKLGADAQAIAELTARLDGRDELAVRM